MTSEKTKKGRLQDSQLKRAKALAGIDTCDPSIDPPPGAVVADQGELAHNNTYGRLPRFYEVAKGNINTDAVLCRSCREKDKMRKEEARQVHLKGLAKKHGNNE